MRNANKLGYYLWKRINQDQESLSRTHPPNIRGLYFNRKDLDTIINALSLGGDTRLYFLLKNIRDDYRLGGTKET